MTKQKTNQKLTRLQVCARVKALKPGGSFTVYSKSERVMALQEAGNLLRFGLVDFVVETKSVGGGAYLVKRVPDADWQKVLGKAVGKGKK